MADWRERIEANPEVMFGKPVITGTRIPVEHILRKLAANMNFEAIRRDYPALTLEDIQAALAYACDVLSSEEIVLMGTAG